MGAGQAGATKLDGLQAGRAVAALMVVAFHAHVFNLPKQMGIEGSWSGFAMGYAGVEFFFVLSGFIMAYVHGREFGQSDLAGRFLIKRVIRIYPTYWLVLLPLIAIYLLVPEIGPDRGRDPVAIVTSLFLWPTGDVPVLFAAWTLQHEMLFYLIFTVFFWSLAGGRAVFVAWTILCIAAIWIDLPHPWSFLFSSYNVLFALGILAWRIYPALNFGTALLAFWLGLGLFLATGFAEALAGYDWQTDLRTLSYGIGASGLVAGLAAGALRVPGWLVLLGDASYMIYLAHSPINALVAVSLAAIGAAQFLPAWVALALIVILAAAVGTALHLWLERPLIGWLTRRAVPKRPAV